MKEMKINISILLAIFALMLTAWACKDDLEDFKADGRLLNKEGITIEKNNPKTNKPYTKEELADIDYDPSKSEIYLENQPIVLKLGFAARPKEIKVILLGKQKLLTTIKDFTENSGKFYGTLATNIKALEIAEIGEKETLLFNVTYDDLGVQGFDYASLGSIRFEVKKGDPFAGVFRNFVYLRKKTGELIPLKATTDNVTNKNTDLLVGAVVEYDGKKNFSTIQDPDTQLAFRYESDYSVGFWVNTTSTDSDPVMIGDQNWKSSGNKGMSIGFLKDKWRVAISNGAGQKADARTSGKPFNDGKWHFLLVTVDRDAKMTMYQDGEKVAEANMAAVTGSIKSGNPLRIAQDGPATYGQFFQGSIGNTYMYDYVLTAEEAASESTIYQGVKLKRKMGASSNIAVTNSGGKTSVEKGRFVYAFEGNKKDASKKQHATLKRESNLNFRYTKDYSISFWVNTTSTDSDPVMIGDQDWNSSGNKGLSIAFRNNNWRVAVSNGAGKKADARTQGLNIPFNDGKWHLLVATFDRDGDMIMYQDGNQVAKASMAGVDNTTTENPLRLAHDGPGTYAQYFEGKIADVGIYDYVLTPSEIATIFKTE